MAQFLYRLQTLLDQKVQAKEAAQRALATAQEDLRVARDELEACRQEQKLRAGNLQRARTDWMSAAIGGSSGERMRLSRDYIGRLQDEYDSAVETMRAQELSVNEAEERLVSARGTLASRSRDVEVLEKHRTRLERRFDDEAARKEALDQEETANVMFLRRGRTT